MRYIKEKAPSVKSKVKQINKKIGKLVSKKEDAINKAKEEASMDFLSKGFYSNQMGEA